VTSAFRLWAPGDLGLGRTTRRRQRDRDHRDRRAAAARCKGLARRVPLGLARTGTTGSHFSGDIFLAFSTANGGSLSGPRAAADGPAYYDELRFVRWPLIDPLCAAAVQCVAEAVINALVAAPEMAGVDGHRSPRLPHHVVAEAFGAGAGPEPPAPPS
jgi:D-aminopeptidase